MLILRHSPEVALDNLQAKKKYKSSKPDYAEVCQQEVLFYAYYLCFLHFQDIIEMSAGEYFCLFGSCQSNSACKCGSHQ